MPHHADPGRVDLRDGSHTLVVTRTLATTRDDAWAWVTHPELLAQWIGLLEGEARVGATVAFTMTAEENAPPESARIIACDRGRSYTCEVGGAGTPDSWIIGCELDGPDGAIALSIVQPIDSAEMAGMMGPGWEYYLDRLLAARTASTMPDFDDYYPAHAAHYEGAFAAAH